MAEIALHLQPDLRVLAGEGRQRRGHGPGGEVLRHPQAQRLARLAQLLLGLGQQRQDAACQAQQGLPRYRGHHLASAPVQQRAAELLLEAPHLLADGGLGQVDALTGAGEAAGLYDGDKTAQQLGIQHVRFHL
ncbi:hypothetical protein D3C72_1900610 [compost metagenome]